MLIRVNDYIVNLDNMLFASNSDPATPSSSAELFFTNSSLIIDGVSLDELWVRMSPETLTMSPGESPEDFLNRLTRQQETP